MAQNYRRTPTKQESRKAKKGREWTKLERIEKWIAFRG